MAMPGNVTSTTPVPGTITGGRALGVTPWIDYEDGGVALNDPSQGLLYQVWRGRLLNGEVVLDAPSVAETVVYANSAMTEMSFTFDQNMRPVVALVADDVAYLYWYDSTLPGQTTTEIGAGVITPKVILDDKRPLGLANSDVVLAYIRAGYLRTRIQRDRFLIEYTHDTVGEDAQLIKVGFNSQLRLQFIIGTGS